MPSKTLIHRTIHRRLACSCCGQSVVGSYTESPEARHYATDEAGWPSHRCTGGVVRPFDTDLGPAPREPLVTCQGPNGETIRL